MTEHTRLELAFGDIVLRDRIKGDVADYMRWYTDGADWDKWDAPWEPSPQGDELKALEEEMYSRLTNPLPHPRGRMEICYQGIHIGTVNAYHINKNPNMRAIGIGIADSGFWGKGLGKQAFLLWTAYNFSASGKDTLYCETWSGNHRMIALAAKVGFRLAKTDKGCRVVEGVPVDNHQFVLTGDEFSRLHSAYLQHCQRLLP